MFIRKGVPCRNNVWKHLVVDALQSQLTSHRWRYQAFCGDEVSVCNQSPVQYAKPYCGERDDSFLVSLRLIDQFESDRNVSQVTRRTGYNELFEALWPTQRTRPCTHASKQYNTLVLPPDCAAISGFGDRGGLEPVFKVHICLTAGNRASRWRALIAIITGDSELDYTTAVLLKDLGCCLRCAVDQALAAPTKCFLVL